MSKYLVTGAAGFIGSNLCRKLLIDGHEVVGIDNLWLGKEANVPEGVKFSFADVRQLEQVEKAMEGCDGVFHQAAASSVTMYKDDPSYFWTTNVDGFHNVLLCAEKIHIPVVYASSSSLYNGHLPPHNEEMKPELKTHYELSMHSRELLGRVAGVPNVGLRYFSVYGPNEEHKGGYANLVSQFLWAMAKNERPKIYGDGSQTRDFTHVDDVVVANLKAMDYARRGKRGVFNVGTGEESTVMRMLGALSDIMGRPLNPAFVENPVKNYVERIRCDTYRARERLGFEAKIELYPGIEMLVQYYKEIGVIK